MITFTRSTILISSIRKAQMAGNGIWGLGCSPHGLVPAPFVHPLGWSRCADRTDQCPVRAEYRSRNPGDADPVFASIYCIAPVCTENLNPHVVVMKSAKDRA